MMNTLRIIGRDLPVILFTLLSLSGCKFLSYGDAPPTADSQSSSNPTFGGLVLAVGASSNSAYLRWNPSPSSDVVAYNIYRNGNLSTPLAQVPVGTNFYWDGALPPATMFYYVVRAVNESGLTDNNQITKVATTLSYEVPNFRGATSADAAHGKAGLSEIGVDWGMAGAGNTLGCSSAQGYRVYVSTTPGAEDFTSPYPVTGAITSNPAIGPYVSGFTTLSAIVGGLTKGTTYFFVVRSFCYDGTMVYGDLNPVEVSATTFSNTPPVTPPTVIAMSPSAGPLAGGQFVTIYGTNFENQPTVPNVNIGNSACTGVSFLSSTVLTCTTPPTNPSGYAGQVNVTVVNPDAGTGYLALGYTYTTVPAPLVTSVTPSSGPQSGGQTVDVGGTGFSQGAVVSIGGITCSNPTWISSTQISCTTSANSAGSYNVVVTNSDTQTGTLINGYTFQAPPTLNSISPVVGPLAGGSVLALNGTGFLPGATVSVGGVSCTSLNVVSSSLIDCTTPAGSAGAVNIVVTNPDGQSATLTNAFTYQPAPTVTSILPNAGTTAGGTAVTINGTGFVSGATVTIGGVSCSSVNVASSAQLTCTTQAGPAGLQQVAVTNPDGQVGTLSPPGGYTYENDPTVTSVSPAAGTPSGGTAITITGTGFVSGANVQLGGTNCTSITVVSATQITCTTPAHAVGQVTVAVINPDGQSVSLTKAYLFTNQGPPVIGGISPNIGNVSGGENVTITGNSFASPTVTIGGVACTVNSSSGTQIDCTTGGHSAARVSVVVINNDLQSATLANSFTYTTVAAPTITSISPSAGALGGGTTVSIIGTAFVSGLTLKIGGANCGSLTLINSSSFTCTTSTNIAGTDDVVVTNPDTQTATLAAAYTYEPAPTVSAASPVGGPLGGGTTVSVKGSNFQSGAVVTIGGNPGNSVQVIDSQHLTFVTPSSTGGTFSISVKNPDNQSGNLASAFTYEAGPKLLAVLPAAAAAGTTVTLLGTGFLSGISITLGGVACTGVSLISSYKLTCAVGAGGSGVGNAVVTNFDGQNDLIPSGFTYGAFNFSQVHLLAGPYSTVGWQDGTGGAAKFFGNRGLALVGNTLYVGDALNFTIRAINLATGQVSTIAGLAGSSGCLDNVGTAARFANPNGLATDGVSLYVADASCHAIRQVQLSTGQVTTFVGTSSLTGTADGVGNAARFLNPEGITFDNAHTLYVSDGGNNNIRQIDIPTATVTTLAGSIAGGVGSNGTADGVGTNARFFSPWGMTTDGYGNLFVADYWNHSIRKIDLSTQNVTTFAGTTGSFGFANGTGSAALFHNPQDIATDGTYLYVADSNNNDIRKISLATASVSILSGSSVNSAGTVDGNSGNARFTTTAGLVTDGTTLYVSDLGNQLVREIALSTGSVTTVAGLVGAKGYAEGSASAIRFLNAKSFASDGTNLYVSDTGNAAIRQIPLGGGTSSVLAGNLVIGAPFDAIGTNAVFDQVAAMTTDKTYLYVSDVASIRQVNLNTAQVTTIAGTYNIPGSADGAGNVATFGNSMRFTTDGANIYIVDSNNNTIRQMVIATQQVTTLAGLAGTNGSTDGIGSAAQFKTPTGIATDGTNLYVADQANCTIRQIVIANRTVTTLAGAAGVCNNLDAATGSAARFVSPTGISTDGTNLYVTQINDNVVRQVVISTGQTTTLFGSTNAHHVADIDGALSSDFTSGPTEMLFFGNRIYFENAYNIRYVQ